GTRGMLMARKKIRIGIIGVGNCASSLVQGINYYRDSKDNEPVPGLMHVELGGYRPEDIEVASAFDVAEGKVGRDVSDALFASPNNTFRRCAVPSTGVTVRRGPTLDCTAKYLRRPREESHALVADVASVLRESRTDCLSSYLSVGSERAKECY